MRFIISLLLTPLLIFLELIAVSLYLYYKKKIRFSKIIFILAFVWLFIISTQIISDYPIKYLERKYNTLSTVPNSFIKNETYILVLGGGHSIDTTLPYSEQLNYIAHKRLIEAMRLLKQLPKGKIITSGYSDNNSLTQAEVLKQAAIESGVPDSLIITMPEPWNTKSEAFEYKKRFGISHNLILVTDAIHMNRSMYLFNNQGISPLPAPTNFMFKDMEMPFYKKIIPSGATISNVERTIHEYIGILWVYVGGN